MNNDLLNIAADAIVVAEAMNIYHYVNATGGAT